MKKIALFALAALCVTAAQAITCSWDNSSTFEGFKDANGKVVKIDATKEFSISFVFSAVAPTEITTANAMLFMLGKTGTNEKAEGTLGFGRAGLHSWSANNNYQANIHVGATTTKTTNGDFSYVRVNNETKVKMTFKDYDATSRQYKKIGFDVVFNNASPTYTYDAEVAFGTDVLEWTSLYVDSHVTLKSMELTATVVPEPTALALLALGVAGLALKRKHA